MWKLFVAFIVGYWFREISENSVSSRVRLKERNDRDFDRVYDEMIRRGSALTKGY